MFDKQRLEGRQITDLTELEPKQMRISRIRLVQENPIKRPIRTRIGKRRGRKQHE